MFATHNRESCEVVLERMVEERLVVMEGEKEGREVLRVGSEVARRVTLGQLYGSFLLSLLGLLVRLH